MYVLQKLRFKAARTRLRAPWAWLLHRGLGPSDVLLASFPRSGNTWLRFQLIEILTGSSPSFDNMGKVIPDLGSHRSVPPVLPGQGRLIKTHEPYRSEYMKAIYLVRDIRDVALSKYAHDKASGKLKYCDFTRYDDEFDGYLTALLQGTMSRAGSWQHHVQSWLESPLAKSGNLLLVRFEDMRQRTEEALVRILEFLGSRTDDKVIREAIVNNSLERMRTKEDCALTLHKASEEDDRFVRRGLVGGWLDRLTAAQLEQIQHHAASALARLGYPVADPATQCEGTQSPPQQRNGVSAVRSPDPRAGRRAAGRTKQEAG